MWNCGAETRWCLRPQWADGMSAGGGSAEFFGLSFMTPNNNLFVDPRWGRGQGARRRAPRRHSRPGVLSQRAAASPAQKLTEKSPCSRPP